MSQTDMWAAPAAAAHPHEVFLMVQVAKMLALKAGPSGITIDNVLTYLAQQNALPLMGKGRQHSFFGAVCRKAGLIASGKRVRSKIDGKNGNLRQIWLHPYYVSAP